MIRMLAGMLAAWTILAGARVTAQEIEIGIVDFYGLRELRADDVRRVLVVQPGDKLSLAGDEKPSAVAQSERRVAALPGVRQARLELVCCESGRAIIYVGVEERATPPFQYRASPRGAVRLSQDVVDAAKAFDLAFQAAVLRGDAGENHTEGHALSTDPAVRGIQQRFGVFAARDLTLLRRVLREASDEAQRAIAAQVLAYANDKPAVVPELVSAVADPGEQVRNNAMRALAVFAGAGIRVPIDPFIRLMNSPVWTDRNKATMAVMALTEDRAPATLAAIRDTAMPSLVEMARWTSAGHAAPALTVLTRLAGRPDTDVDTALRDGTREQLIAAALSPAPR